MCFFIFCNLVVFVVRLILARPFSSLGNNWLKIWIIFDQQQFINSQIYSVCSSMHLGGGFKNWNLSKVFVIIVSSARLLSPRDV